MREFLDDVKTESERDGLYLSVEKTKLMAIGSDAAHNITADGKGIEWHELNFLGSYITEKGDCEKEIDREVHIGRTAVDHLNAI